MPRPGQLLTASIDAMRRSSAFSRSDLKALLKRLDMAATRGVKFIGPKAATLDKRKPMLVSDLRPPYPVTVLEGELFDVGGVAALIVARDTDEGVELNFLTHTADDIRDVFTDLGEWIVAPLVCRIPYTDASMHEPYHMDVKILLRDYARDNLQERGLGLDSYKPLIQFYAAVCQLLANHNVETQDIEPDAKENRSRKIRGKAPLFTYKTLVIGSAKKRQRVGSGTHASPRSHLRRGYYRTSKKGVRHWVQACVVKGETPGFVHKDYRIEGELNNG